MPCRSASASLPVAIWYSSLRAISDAIAYGGRAVHPDLAVPVERHEPPRRVDQRVHHGEVEAGAARRSRPSSRRSRRRAGRRRCGRRPSRIGVEVEHRRQVVDVGAQEVVRLGDAPRARVRDAAHAVQVGARGARSPASAIQPVASVSAGPPCGGLYLNPPSRGGLCDGVTTMPSARPAPVVRPPLARRIACDTAGVGREAVGGVDEHRDVVRDQHLDRAHPGRLGQPVRVPAEEQRAVEALGRAVLADRLRGGQDVRLVERCVQARPAVPGRAERDLLARVARDRARTAK